MARGDTLKKTITDKLLEVFPGSFVVDRKIYVPGSENGEAIQVAISLTAPKVLVESTGAPAPKAEKGEFNFGDNSTVLSKPNIEISDEERKNIEDLIKSLGL